MMRLRVPLTALVALAAVLVGGAGPAVAADDPVIPTLVDIRAANHATYDRLVFEFLGPLPEEVDVGYVPQIIQDGSGEPVQVVGSALLNVRLAYANGHDEAGNVTFGALRRTYALPNIIQVVTAGDFEAVLTFGVGLAQQAPFRVSRLTAPSRVVIDIDTPSRTVPILDYFIDNANQQQTRAVSRPVIPPAVAAGALQRLFAGPTEAERASGLAFVSSGATGFGNLSIVDGVARVRLIGGCDSKGSTITIANQIMPTLKQFSSVQWVKIYDPAGSTEVPNGRSDSIPFCLEP